MRSFLYGDMVKLADTGDLKSPVFGLAGSSPAIPTSRMSGTAQCTFDHVSNSFVWFERRDDHGSRWLRRM